MEKPAEFKQTARAVRAAGDYDAMMRQEGLYEVGARLVRRIGAGEDVLDIACGTVTRPFRPPGRAPASPAST